MTLGGQQQQLMHVRWCQKGQLSRQRVPKSVGINDVIMPNTTQLAYGMYGIRALSGKRVAANTIEAVRRWVGSCCLILVRGVPLLHLPYGTCSTRQTRCRAVFATWEKPEWSRAVRAALWL